MTTSVLKAQAGELSFGTISTNSTTGYGVVPISWTDNTYTSTSVFAVRVDLYINAGTVLCIDETLTKNSVASPFSPSDVTISSGSISISKFNVTLPSDFTPLIVLYFRDAPGETSVVGIGSIHQVVPTIGMNITINLPPSDTIHYVSPPGFAISGLIRKAPMPSGFGPPECDGGSNLGIPDITVSYQASTSCFAGGTTNPFSEYTSDGYYGSSNIPGYYVYDILPIKDDETTCDCGLGMEDIDTARLYILEVRHPTLQQLIAADFNGNDTLTTYDLYLMSACLGDIISSPYLGWRPWRFVSKTIYNANNPPPSTTVVPSMPHSITTTSLKSNLTNQDFYGIKRGDVVEQDCTECGEDNNFTSSEDRVILPRHDIFFEDCSLKSGQEHTLPIRFSAIQGMTILSLELLFDTESIEILGVEKVNATELDYLNYGVKKQETADALRLIWFTMELEGLALEKQDAVFRVHIRAKKDITSLSNQIWQNAGGKYNQAICSNSTNHRVRLNLNLLNTAVESLFSARLVSANPSFSTTAQFALYMPVASVVTATVYNLNGQQVARTEWTSDEGWNTHHLPGLPETPGMYMVHILSNFGSETIRLIKN